MKKRTGIVVDYFGVFTNLEKAHHTKHIPFCVFKVTGLGSATLLEKINSRLPLTPEETAQALNISRTKVFELLQGQALKSVKIGKSRRIPTDAGRQPARGSDREDVQLRGGLAHHRRRAADPRTHRPVAGTPARAHHGDARGARCHVRDGPRLPAGPGDMARRIPRLAEAEEAPEPQISQLLHQGDEVVVHCGVWAPDDPHGAFCDEENILVVACAVENLLAGDLVLSQNTETGELTYKPVLRTTVRPKGKTFRVTAESEVGRGSTFTLWLPTIQNDG